jgi:hypothetical protein
VSIDKNAPTIAVKGNSGTYSTDQQVLITCGVTDGLSCDVSSVCDGVDAPASSFGVGEQSRTVTVSDIAGNTSTFTYTFAVTEAR